MPDRSMLTLGTVLATLGFLVVTSVSTGAAERRKALPRKTELVSLIETRRSSVDDLDLAVAALRSDLAEAQLRASRATAQDRRHAQARADLAQRAGTVAVHGPGIDVVLSPSDRTPPSAEEAGAYQIHDTDLQLVVNALWAAGAEAIAINGSRMVSTTPIRTAGATIVVNFRPLSPPFVVSAIGAERVPFEASEIARRFRRWTVLFGLGFQIKDRPNIEVPGYTGRVPISTATPE